MFFDTIAAISTPLGTGGVSIIRVSGNNSIAEINKIFKGKDLTKTKTHTITHGFILNKNKTILDEVLISVFKTPNSFTGENVVEINAHGGILITQMVLERVLSLDIRLAFPGEFSQRAYLNGKMDLIQAESIMDLIHATNENAIKIAHSGLQKYTSQLVTSLRDQILNLIAQIEVNIDYPEYDDIPQITQQKIALEVKSLINQLENILNHSHKNRYLKEGIKTLIVGRPNVGKSSLLNAFLNETKAIVSDISGTTRDFVEAYFNCQGITLHLIDTAGIRKTDDPIEKIGILRTEKILLQAELILLVLDQSNHLQEEDIQLLQLTKNHPRIIIGNKADLKSDKLISSLSNNSSQLTPQEIISVSSLDKTGFLELQQTILKKFQLNDIQPKDFNYFSNARHINQIQIALRSFQDLQQALLQSMPIDIYSIDLTTAYQALGQIIGDNQENSLIKELFSKFCLGK
ncbi:MAG: tRNA uridine-5-carboxymethylaminomethyl(34) synthesis GTPase MnmE [Candidatus Phytoplasma asteris]|uniref:tRNA modification GTPase MnmE n=1 Tax='Chrysanthemum coronarium' phytoplasma TaxID=1520703 RepID=A0ABQ0J1T6_9MOLU|nr:tRNA uridine-5-carboxymethylaminomethyl(34) synthesis GTPase MnmE ['Chrysanthemum coronarium' phytoplasma]TKA87747.1 MAG: tRNA modification GTPase [Periwinkle leaf yellowing phytoplasma]WEX20111.1 MAG: tRNA uridine-5-carboxymethylaminomethyl(34) synthesis GTPase MnmE [Candidatus Phytoplasma asteris]GAK73574.1 tRNA modification GTPase ['Chrysanthemum coronarium' phytoplasma]